MCGIGACSPASKIASSNAPTPATTASASTPEPAGRTYAKTSAAAVANLDDHAWPPPAIAPDAKAAKAEFDDEGRWLAFDRKWMHTLPGAPPTFYTTTVRPDPNRKARVQIVALDARQLELDMAIGVEGPFPPDEGTKGKWPRGGMLPREKKIATRVVAAFNGGFRFDQGKWGMMIDRREFLPPVKDVASLLMHDDGRLGFGSWGPTMKTPDDVRSLRQNLDPLIDDGVINPRKRLRWGGINPQAVQVGQRAKRTGICRTAAGDFLYLWGNDLEALDLGTAMKKAGCDYGMHLDMNVFHVGFVFLSFDDADYEQGDSEVLSPNMGANKKRYVKQPSPKEFFYATLRDPSPVPGFSADSFVQPPPAWLPSVLIATESEVRLTFFAAARVQGAIVAGDAESLLGGAPPAPLPGDDATRVLAAIRLGIAPKDVPLGLVLDGIERSKPSAAAGTLAIDEQGRWSIAPAGTPSTAKHSLQAPLVIDGGKGVATPTELVMALGVTARGDLIVAEKKAASTTPAQLIASLVRAGCTRAIAPRGAGAGKLERTGRDEILVGGPDTRLYILAGKPPSATYRFDRDENGAPRWPKVTTPVTAK